METAKKTHLKKSTRALLICLALLICVSVLNWAIVSNGGDVKIRRIKLLGTDGLTYSALMYVPSNATDATPAPAIILYHGGAGNARNHESWSVEFARRGYVCLAIDWNGSGESEAYKTGTHTEVWDVYSNVPEMWLKYLMEVPCVDKDNIMTSGHSMGVRPAAKYAKKYNLKAALLASGAGMVASVDDSSISGEFLKGYDGAVLMTLGSADIDSIELGVHYMNFAATDMGKTLRARRRQSDLSGQRHAHR